MSANEQGKKQSGGCCTPTGGSSERTMARDPEGVVERVRERYGQIADRGVEAAPAAGALSKEIGYSDADLAEAPEQANLGVGCGAPIRSLDLKPGETVLDLGSGGGLDATLAAHQVGPEGRVIGVDMTPEMLDLARDNARRAGLDQIEYREGRLEQLPVEDDSVDAVTSNCVINLVPDKKSVFDEIVRVLKPGGRLVVSDIVLGGTLPDAVMKSVLAYVGCVAGALPRERYFEIVEQAGLQNVEILKEFDYSSLADECLPDELGSCISNTGVAARELQGKILSVTFRAWKPS